MLRIENQGNGIWLVKDGAGFVCACVSEDQAKTAMWAIETWRKYSALATGR